MTEQPQQQRQAPTPTRTITQTVTTTAPPILRLAANREPRTEVTWDESVIDNEHLNRKKTKICCIYHPADEDGNRHCDSDSDSSSDSSDSSGDESEKPNNKPEKKKKGRSQKSKPNAYEVQPTYPNRSRVPKQ
ncbi:Type 1 phosphatases regulator YPI1 [Candida viswanathii]|uniref:Type 1 phosphatases regulator n=1 Tax=Candida viswanathii TaxID=5486 RepID=A0A367YCK7_9ASCO|nr:Type 1 phosphatases regulator YPI1 [Candida viswanathii]